MSDQVLVELTEDVSHLDQAGDEVLLWSAGQQIWLDPTSAKSFVEDRKVATVVEEDDTPEPKPGVEVVERKAKPEKAPAAPADPPAPGVV